MIKKEWKALVKHKMLLISFVAMMFIPILYAGFFVKSVWDPYGQTDKLPVAVVNEDQETSFQGQKLHVGKDMIKNLKENDSLDWRFVSAEKAQQGLKNKKYYMIVTIPKNFSERAATVLDKNPKKMNLHYETNGSLNFIAEVIDRTAIKELKSEVSQNVTTAYVDAIADKLGTVKDGFKQAADGSQKLEDGTSQLAEGNTKVTANLNKLANSTLTFSDGANTLNVGLNQYVDGVNQVGAGAVTLNDGVRTLAGKVPELTSGVNQLNSGATSLTSGINQYTSGVATLKNGTTQLASNGQTLINGSQTLVSTVVAGTTQLDTGAKKLLQGLTSLTNSLPTSDQTQQLSAGLTNLQSGITALQAQVQEAANTDTSVLVTNLTSIGTNAATISAEIDNAEAQLSAAATPDTTAQVAAVQQTTAYAALSANEQQEIIQAIQANVPSTGDNSAVIAILDQVKAQAQEITTSTQAMATTLTNMKDSMQQLVAGTTQLKTGADAVIPSANELVSGTDSVRTALTTEINPGVTELDQGILKLQEGVQSGATDLTNGLSQYVAGVGQVDAGATALNDKSSALNSGATQLSQGTGTLAQSVPTLESGVTQLKNGTSQLVSGTSQLTENGPTLVSGTGQLASGAQEIASGSQQLADGSSTLGQGITTLKAGTDELSTKLLSGSNEMNQFNLTSKNVKQISTPTKITKKEYSHVPNYGHALAPYVMSLALFMACIVFNYIYPIRKFAENGQSTISWFLSKVSVGGISAIGMALIEGTIMLLLGLQVDHIFQYYGLLILAALAFMYLVMFISMLFDNVGRFAAVILLVLQLSASGGTFPMQLTGKFFNLIHPFLPMTYSINGLRQAMTSGLGFGTFLNSISILVAIGAASIGLLFLSMSYLRALLEDDTKRMKKNQILQGLLGLSE